jgi:peptidyl-prolyl cis-trans isomerase A (cyclophilin A)
VIQFGFASDTNETKKWETPIADDPSMVQSNRAGTVSFAMSGRDSRTTHVFVNVRDNGGSLDRQGFTPFGRIVQGMDVLTNHVHNPTPNDSGGVNQEKYRKGGNAWLLEQYPAIDLIENTALFVGPANRN